MCIKEATGIEALKIYASKIKFDMYLFEKLHWKFSQSRVLMGKFRAKLKKNFTRAYSAFKINVIDKGKIVKIENYETFFF